jgi:RHS repeat-associated protein
MLAPVQGAFDAGRDRGGLPLWAGVTASGPHFETIHADGLGSITAMTDEAGSVTTRRQYDAWGNLEVGADQPGYAFTGREWDPETGLYYYRARYYDPKIGRFISEDPVRFAAGPNFYAYALANPARWRDPSGMDVTITLYSGVPGHIGISVNGSDPLGFYGSSPNDPRLAWGQNQQGHVSPEREHGSTPVDEVTIATSSTMDAVVLAMLRALSANPGRYNMYKRNCANVVANILTAAGIKVPDDAYMFDVTTPRWLFDALKQEYSPPPRPRLPLDPHLAH